MKIVSLGYDCTIARQLQALGVRDDANPFDWLVSMSTPNLYNCIVCGFDGFIDVEKKKLPVGEFYVNKYDMVFLHHSHISKDELANTFGRRVERFRDALRNRNDLLLIRKLHGKHEAPDVHAHSDHGMDYYHFAKFKEWLDMVNPTVRVEQYISCPTCINPDNRPTLYTPNGDDNIAYRDYLSKLINANR